MDDNDRTLRIEIPGCIVNKSPEEPEWSPVNSQFNGWTVIPTGTNQLFWQGTIDLSGYARDYKTFYPAGGVIQQGAYTAEVGSDGLIVYTAVSSTPLDPYDILIQLAYAGGPGFIGIGIAAVPIILKQQNWTTLLFAESELYVPNANIVPNTNGILQPMTTRQSGSMSPTASQVLYVVKVAWPIAQDNTSMTIPASRVILPGKMDQEPELEYMMRLSRSIELANQV